MAAAAPASQVLILTDSADPGQVAEAVRAGAAGFILKDGSIEELIDGIRIAAGGRSLIAPRLSS